MYFSLLEEDKMKKTLSLFVMASLVLMLGFASAQTLATVAPSCGTYETTFVSGMITDASGVNPIANAEVTVDCDGVEKDTTSEADGSYSVQFDVSECDAGDDVTVTAKYGDLNGESQEVVWHTENERVQCLDLVINVACGNVPLVPEFGTVVGIVTALGALGVFFVVRKQ